MKRSITVFLLAFTITIAAVAAIYFCIHGALPKPGATEPATQPTTAPPEPVAKDDTPTPTPATEPKETTPAVEPTPGPVHPDEATPADEPQRVTLPTPSEKPRNAEHAAALTTAEVLKGDRVEEMLDHMVERGQMTPEAAAALKEWAKTHKVAGIEEVGSSIAPDGTKTTRYRITCTEGKGDMLLSIITSPDGTVRIAEAVETPSDRTTITAASDPLTVAEGFLAAVKKGDMMAARGMVTGHDVSDGTIAGLCMLFDEGEFALREDSPIRGTFSNADHAGYLVYLTDLTQPEDKRPRHIGLEMLRTEGAWRVSAVALDALLSSYEEQGFAEGGRYFPIVKNPKGGDSLALFFAFNKYELTPRSLRQLRIVAELLKQSKCALNISGHTDDVGGETYNLKLSESRAAAVRDALVSFGVEPGQITTHGLGKSQPRRTYSDDDSEKEIDYIRGENRRAEIYLDFES